jgi:uncharacterized protein (UPF0332 family)
LAEGLFKKVPSNPDIVKILEQNAKESIAEANTVKSSLWKIVISYYSMFYMANAVLVKLGYKVGGKIAHKVTSDALIVFVRNKLNKELLEDYEAAQNEALAGIKADEVVESFDFERKKRSIFQYSVSEKAKKSKAEISLKRAKEFMLSMQKLL